MAAESIKSEEFSSWMTPVDAVALLDSKYGAKYNLTSKYTLLERLKGDAVKAAAKLISYDDATKAERCLISPAQWYHVSENSGFWISGDFTVEEIDDTSYSRRRIFTRYYGVKFEPAGVRDVVGSLSDRSPSSPKAAVKRSVARKGGRPPKPLWQDFWIEMCRLLKPNGGSNGRKRELRHRREYPGACGLSADRPNPPKRQQIRRPKDQRGYLGPLRRASRRCAGRSHLPKINLTNISAASAISAGR